MKLSPPNSGTTGSRRRTGRLHALWVFWAGAAGILTLALALIPAGSLNGPAALPRAESAARTPRPAAGDLPGRAGALRYNAVATRQAGHGMTPSPPRGGPIRTIAEFDEKQTLALIESGWRRRVPQGAGFSHHAERVATLAALAREQGYAPSVGAMQAHFGTLEEMARRTAPEQWAELAHWRHQALSLKMAGADPARLVPIEGHVASLEKSLSHRLRTVADGLAPGGWRTINLDVNADGRIDRDDLDAARRGG